MLSAGGQRFPPPLPLLIIIDLAAAAPNIWARVVAEGFDAGALCGVKDQLTHRLSEEPMITKEVIKVVHVRVGCGALG